MSDYKLARACDHVIRDEVLVIDGVTPNYTATLRFKTNGNRAKIFVRDFSRSEGRPEYNPLIDGITDFELLPGPGRQVIEFNHYIGQPGVVHLEGETFIYPQPTYLATYIADKAEDPKCLGEEIMTDIEFDGLGNIEEVRGLELVKQKVVKALLTNRGSNDLAPDYGSSVSDAIGRPNLAFIMLAIQNSIFDAINRLVAAQAETIEFKPDNEIILGIKDLSMDTTSDPRELKVQLTVITGTYEDVKISFSTRA